MAELLVVSAEKTGSVIKLEDGWVIGRGSTADARLMESTLSREHAKLEIVDGIWRIMDLGSKNGTFVNGVPIVTRASLGHGDEIRLGALVFRFQSEQTPAVAPAVDIESEFEGEVTQILEKVSADDQFRLLIPAESAAGELISKRLWLLSEVAEILGGIIEPDEMFPIVLDRLFDAFPEAERGCVMLCDTDGSNLRPVATLTRPGSEKKISVSRSLADRVIRTRSALLSADIGGDGRFDAHHTMVRYGLHTVMCAPMVCEDAVLGLIQLDSSDPRAQFSRSDMAVFLGIAGHTALALGKARLHDQLLAQRLMEKDLQTAEKIQQWFLPKKAPEMTGYRFAEVYSAALGVGGDYYDFIKMPRNAVGIAVGDVCGKGVAAALYMARLCSEMRIHSRGQVSPGAVLTGLNRTLTEEMTTGMFVTLVLMILDPEKRKLTISSAGHMPPLRRAADGALFELTSAGNLPLGVEEDLIYGETVYGLDSGDWIVIYTDGVTEAMNRKGKPFGADRLKALITRGASEPADLLDAIRLSVTEYVAGYPQSDDLTMVCLSAD